MSSPVRYDAIDRVAVITIDNPPVNALGPGVWEAIDEAVARAAADPDVDAIVLIGAGQTFIAGADIKVFKTLKTREQSLERSGRDPCAVETHRGHAQAARRRDPRQRARRRLRSRDGLPLPGRDRGREGRPAGSAARHHSRRGWHAAAATARRVRRWRSRCARTANRSRQARRWRRASSTASSKGTCSPARSLFARESRRARSPADAGSHDEDRGPRRRVEGSGGDTRGARQDGARGQGSGTRPWTRSRRR